MSLFESGVRPIIDEFLLAEAAKKRDYGDYWSASSAGYCMRKLIFERLGVPKNNEDARRQRVFTSGHIFHEWIQGLTKAAGVSIAQEVELQDESLMVRGHFDDLVLTKMYITDTGGEAVFGDTEAKKLESLILYDYKTVNSRSFTWAKKNGNAMSHFHRMQLGTYLYMIRKGKLGNLQTGYDKLFEGLLEARILKISKDDLRMDEQQLMWSEELEKDVLSFWTTLNKYWVDKKLPKCTCADQENGFMAKEEYNGYFFDGEPCSLKYYENWKKKEVVT
jgi:hypothetical protein